MKKVFIPHGETVAHNCLYTGRIVVNGVLKVDGKLSAKEIVGRGVIEAGEIVCDDIRADHVTADNVTAKRIAVNKLFVKHECRASDAIAVKDYARASYVSTGTLSVTLSDISACDTDKVIVLKKKNSLLGLLWASWWRGLYLDLFHGGKKTTPKEEPGAELAVETTVVDSSVAATPDDDKAPVIPQDADAVDMLICVLAEMKRRGYCVTKHESADSERAAA